MIERSKRIDKRESETLMVLSKKNADLENQLNNLIVEKTQFDQIIKDLRALEKISADRQAILESDLQSANFEKNRLKDTLINDTNFDQLREIVNKLQQVVLLRSATPKFSEEEITLFRALFGNLNQLN